MVFRGKPSKACERCRARRTKCNLQTPACGACIRAGVACSGYRNTQQIRIQNESESVARKVNASPPEPRSLSSPLDLQARNVFFACYVTSPVSRCWDFLKQYYHPTDAPPHLTLAIEALSLAYLHHQVYSDAALAIARQKYVLALRMTNKNLHSLKEATSETSLLASLLLDMYEKITDTKPRESTSWKSHVNGALTLVRLRGLENFKDPEECRVLVRLNNHYLSSCVTSKTMVPDEFLAIREYIEHRLETPDFTLQLTNMGVRYAGLRSDIRQGALSSEECIKVATELDARIQQLELSVPPSWQCTAMPFTEKSNRVFGDHIDIYPMRNACQARNSLRVIRILLNEIIMARSATTPQDDKSSKSMRAAQENIKSFVNDILASVPQYTDCGGAARARLPPPEGHVSAGATHLHTPYHQSECYSLIFPLYTAGRSSIVPEARPWVVGQLRFIGSHFYIRNAELVAQSLERSGDIDPWDIYAMLGSYAFTT